MMMVMMMVRKACFAISVDSCLAIEVVVRMRKDVVEDTQEASIELGISITVHGLG
jgi:hypothetical protein